MRRAIEHPDAVGEALLPLLQQMCTWFVSDNTADAVKHMIVAASLQQGLVAIIQRAAVEHTDATGVGGVRRVDLSVAALASRIIGLTSKGYPEGATAFAEVGAVRALCGLMQRWPGDGDVQFNAICALGTISEEDPAIAGAAMSLGAVSLVRAAVNSHPRNSEIQRSGTRALQHFSICSTTASAAPQSGSTSPTSAAENASGQDVKTEHPSRKGLAERVLEKRAADAQPGIVSTAVGWLFSGGKATSSAHQGESSEPSTGRVHSARTFPPAPYLPPSGVPRLDVPSAREMPMTREAPDDVSDQEEAPLTPPVVRNRMHVWDQQENECDPAGGRPGVSPRSVIE